MFCPGRVKEHSGFALKGSVCVLIFLAALFLRPAFVSAQSLEIDLGEMAEKLKVRYYIAEKGAVPREYILLGGMTLYPNFLTGTFDLRERIVEYDDETDIVYTYRVPKHRRFIRREEQRGVFIYYTPRDVTEPEIEIELSTLDRRQREIGRSVRQKVWVEDVKYNLRLVRDEGRRRGLLNINIPVKLPKQIERIIGRGEETNLTVSGRESIKIGGESNWCANCPQTEGRPRQQKFPDLDMEQQLSVNLHGNIGEKINVAIDHSSMGGGIQSTNRVRINYKGFDDDIIKLIEMGDTDLILSGAQLISYSGGAKGLFGVKGMAQVGPLDLTVIASKEEGETATGSFTSTGAAADERRIRDYDYIRRQFYYLENPGPDFENPVDNWRYVYAKASGGDRVRVFVTLRDDLQEELTYTGAKFNIIAYADPENNGLTDSIGVGTGIVRRYKELIWGEDFDYIQEYGGDEVRYMGLRLYQPLDERRQLAVIYRAREYTPGTDFKQFVDFDVGSYTGAPDPLYAELICPLDNEFTPQSPTWKMMMRNVYSTGMTGIDARSLTVRIENIDLRQNFDIDPNYGEGYLRIFGLDQWDETGSVRVPGSDDRIDSDPAILNLDIGYIMFPWPEPFSVPEDLVIRYFGYPHPDSVPPEIAAALHEAYAELVKRDTLYNSEVETYKTNTHKYDIVIEGATGQRTFQLSAFDIIEGSEVITIDGTRLKRGEDYEIDYSMGTVKLKGDVVAEMPPDARVQISYQHKPLIGGGKSSLLGVGANLNLSRNSRINGTFLYNSVGASRYSPRLGEEPAKMMAFDVNGNFQFNPRLMTSIANLLPRVDTDAESSVNLNGEIAVSIPNPNVKGEAYIDDMEGIEDSDMISLLRRSWYEASPPYKYIGEDEDEYFGPVDSLESSWFNPNRTDQAYLATSKRDLNPGLDPRENTSVTSLFMRVNDYSGRPDEKKWYGIMTGFPGGIDLTTAQYLEIWVNDFQPDSTQRRGILHVDFGNIDEDFYEPNEQQFNVERDPETYIWNSEYDIGFDDDDRCQYPVENLRYDAEKGTYTNVNCRAANGIQDSEDLNKNGYLETSNAYYTLRLDLRDSAIVDIQRDFDKVSYADYWDEGDTDPNRVKAWRMYRLDLSKMKEVERGAPPRMDAIQHMRFWIENVDELNGLRKQVLEIAQAKFVGSRWEFDGIRDLNDEPIPLPASDMLVKIGSINNKENPDYRSPYSVEEEEGITNREQSLVFGFENLQEETSFRSIKRFYGSGQDYRQYRELQFWVYPDVDTLGLGLDAGTILSFYLQVAYDSFNYYEIEVPLSAGDMREWILATVNLGDLTNMKIQSTGELIEREISDAIDPDRYYTAKVFGDPTLFQVRFLYAGVRNRSGELIREGQVYFNDLKLGGVRRDIDHAERMSFSSNFANIFQLSASWQRTGPEFRSLKQKTGSGVTNSSFAFNGKTKVNHIIPTAGFDLPISGKYASSTSLPKYIPQSDVEIADDAVRDSLKTVNESYSFSVSLSRGGSTNLLMKHLFDNLKTGFNYSKKSLKSHNALDTTWTMSGNLNYQVHFRKDRQIKLFRGIKWRYWLSNFSYTSSASRRTRRYYSLSGGEFVKRPLNFGSNWDNEISTLYEPFETVKLSFNMSEKRNLAVDHNFHGLPIGVRTDYSHDLMFQFQPRGGFFLLSQFNPNFEYRSRYREDLKPSIRQGEDPFGTRDVSNNRNINIVFDFDLARYVTRIGQMVNLVEEGEVQRSTHRRGRSSAQQKEDFKEWLKEQKQPPKSEKAGKVESILGPDKPPPTTEEPAPPPPTETVPPVEEPARDETPAEKGIDRLGITQPREVAAPPEEEEKKDEPEEKAAAPDTAAGRRYDPLILPKQLFRVVGRVEPIKTSIRLERNSSYQRLHERAAFGYQMGFTDEAGVRGKSSEKENKPDRATGSFMIDFNTGLALTSTLDIDFRTSITKSTSEISGGVTETERWTYPSMTFKWSGIEKKRLLSRFIKQSDMTVKFERKIQKSVRGEETDYQLSPNWNLVWKNDLSTNLALSYSQRNWEEARHEMWKRSWSVNLDTKYNFEAARGFNVPLPFLSKKTIKFKSTLTTALNVAYTRMTSYNQPPSSTISVSPRASYKFSNRITGSLNMNYTRNAGGILGYVYHKVSMHISAEFTF